jgi:hypothetical protein
MKHKTKNKHRVKTNKLLSQKIMITLIILFLLVSMYFVSSNPPSAFQVKINSPQNKTYYVNNVILNVSSNFLASEIFQSIDNSPVFTECSNCTGFVRYDLIFNNGAHDIKIYAKDFHGRITLNEIQFAIQK